MSAQVRTLIIMTLAGACGAPPAHLSTGRPAAEPEQAVAAPFCPALPPPEGPVIEVGPSEAVRLPEIVSGASPGHTILLADGTYDLEGGKVLITRRA